MAVELVGLYLDKEPIHFDEGCMPAFFAWHQWLNNESLLMLLRTGSSFTKVTIRKAAGASATSTGWHHTAMRQT